MRECLNGLLGKPIKQILCVSVLIELVNGETGILGRWTFKEKPRLWGLLTLVVRPFTGDRMPRESLCNSAVDIASSCSE